MLPKLNSRAPYRTVTTLRYVRSKRILWIPARKMKWSRNGFWGHDAASINYVRYQSGRLKYEDYRSAGPPGLCKPCMRRQERV